MSAKRSVAGRIGKLGLDDAFTEAETRSMAGQACEIWCHRDRSGRPVAYRVVTCHPDRDPRAQWERVARFPAEGGASKSTTQGAFPKSA